MPVKAQAQSKYKSAAEQKKVLALLTGIMTLTVPICYATVSADNIAIADVAPGSSVETAKQKLGTPQLSGDKLFFPNGIVIEAADHSPNIVKEIMPQSAGTTPAGIHLLQHGLYQETGIQSR